MKKRKLEKEKISMDVFYKIQIIIHRKLILKKYHYMRIHCKLDFVKEDDGHLHKYFMIFTLQCDPLFYHDIDTLNITSLKF